MIKQLYIEDYRYILSRGHGTHVKVVCPFCDETRGHKGDKSLSIERSTYLYKCHHCEAKGRLVSKFENVLSKEQIKYMASIKTYKKPKPTEEANKKLSEPLLDYFKERGISEKTLEDAKISKETAYFPQINAMKGCIGFNYYLGDELINVKYRTRDKLFTLVSGAELIPYNINSISIDSYYENEDKTCIFVEGEMDALTYLECGFKHVVSVPNGANKNLEYLDEFIESHFDNLETIYVSVDNDSKGLVLKDELLRRFGKDRCKVVCYPEGCKDINEVLMRDGKAAVCKCIENAIELKPEGILELSDVEDNLDFIFEHGLSRGATIGIKSVDDILSFKTGMLSIVTGVPTHGKTFMLNYILSRLNIIHDWKIAFFSPEFYPVSENIAQMIETMGGKRFNNVNYSRETYDIMKEYICRNIFWIDPDDTDINSVMERSKYLIKKKGIKALVIDPFNSLTDNDRKSQKQDEYISEFLQKLRWFARKYDVAVFLVMHPTKMQKLENGLYPVCDLYNCKGASEIYDKADIGITVWRNEIENYCELHVTKIKFRHLGEKGCAAFRFDIRNGRFAEIENIKEWSQKGMSYGEIPVTYDDSNFILKKVCSSIEETNCENIENTSQAIKPNTDFDTTDNDIEYEDSILDPNNNYDLPY